MCEWSAEFAHFLLFDVICRASTSRRAPEETPRSLRFASAALIIQWFRRQRGILGSTNTHQHTNPWTVTAPIVPPKQCLHFDVCDAWPAQGTFLLLFFHQSVCLVTSSLSATCEAIAFLIFFFVYLFFFVVVVSWPVNTLVKKTKQKKTNNGWIMSTYLLK